MNKQTNHIAQLLHSVTYQKPWFGTSLEKILTGITAKQAAARPIENAHTIWELVQHMINWRIYVIKNLTEGKYSIEIDSEQDFTTITDTSIENWKRTMDEFYATTQQLVDAINAFDVALLQENLPVRPFSHYALFHGIIHHDIYHTGQIAILKKLV